MKYILLLLLFSCGDSGFRQRCRYSRIQYKWNVEDNFWIQTTTVCESERTKES